MQAYYTLPQGQLPTPTKDVTRPFETRRVLCESARRLGISGLGFIVTNSFLLLVVRPGATSSALLLVEMPFVTNSLLLLVAN